MAHKHNEINKEGLKHALKAFKNILAEPNTILIYDKEECKHENATPFHRVADYCPDCRTFVKLK